MKFQFTRFDSGELDPNELKEFGKEFPAEKENPTVTLGLWRAADKSFTAKTLALQFDQKISFDEAWREMARREPELFRISRLRYDMHGMADVGLVS